MDLEEDFDRRDRREYIPDKVFILKGKHAQPRRKETKFMICASSFACYLITHILWKLRLREVHYLSKVLDK